MLVNKFWIDEKRMMGLRKKNPYLVFALGRLQLHTASPDDIVREIVYHLYAAWQHRLVANIEQLLQTPEGIEKPVRHCFIRVVEIRREWYCW